MMVSTVKHEDADWIDHERKSVDGIEHGLIMKVNMGSIRMIRLDHEGANKIDHVGAY